VLYQRVAKQVLSETLRLTKGETLTIETWNSGLPFAKRLLVEAKRLGAIPVMLFEDEATYIEGVKTSQKDVLGTMGKHEYALLAGSDAYIFIPGPPIGAFSPHLSRQEVNDSTRYNASWYEAAEKAKLRGARLPFGYVGKDYARVYRKKPEEFARHQLRAALADLPSISSQGAVVGEALTDGALATVKTGGGNLEFTLKGELEIEDGIVDEKDVAAGHNMTYMPPGYVSKEVDQSSASGWVAISPSMTRLGLLRDAELEFDRGRIVEWKSRSSSKMLNELVETTQQDKRVLSFVTVGLNPSMRFEFGQDRMVSGAISLGGFGFSGILRKGSLLVAGKVVVEKGKLARPT